MAFWYVQEPGLLGPVFGSKDYFRGMGIFLDTYSNHNGPHDVCFVIWYSRISVFECNPCFILARSSVHFRYGIRWRSALRSWPRWYTHPIGRRAYWLRGQIQVLLNKWCWRIVKLQKPRLRDADSCTIRFRHSVDIRGCRWSRWAVLLIVFNNYFLSVCGCAALFVFWFTRSCVLLSLLVFVWNWSFTIHMQFQFLIYSFSFSFQCSLILRCALWSLFLGKLCGIQILRWPDPVFRHNLCTTQDCIVIIRFITYDLWLMTIEFAEVD